MSEPIELQTLTVRGTAREMGRQYGEACRDLIHGFVEQRFSAAREHFREHARTDDEAYQTAGRACEHITEAWDPDGYAEQVGIAEGANIEPPRLFAATNMTDVRDVVLYGRDFPAPSPDAEGCSAVILPGSRTRSGQVIAGQNWDLNPPDVDFIVAVQRIPERGLRTWSVTCAGCVTLVGMNERGLCVGTTNLKTTGSKAGVPYLSLLHRAVQSATAEEAAAVIERAPRAAAHSYWLADEGVGIELEADSDDCIRRLAVHDPILRTNHCLHAPLVVRQAEAPASSTLSRYRRLEARLADAHGVDAQHLREVLSDRSDGVDSINRYASDEQGTATNACIICLPADRKIWACRGTPDKGAFRWLAFDAS